MSKKTKLWFVKSKRAQTNDDFETWVEGGIVPTLNSFDIGDTRATVLIFEATRVDDVRIYESYCPTVATYWGTGGARVPYILPKEIKEETMVRRLTPRECERLQGFPDDWTDGQADSHRYKQMGNAVAVPVVEWIINRIVNN
jgi:site-specific DNA-cytosine methylase